MVRAKKPALTPVGMKRRANARAAALKMRQDWFAKMCADRGLPAPVCEFRFAPPRRFRMDYAFPVFRVALEQEGGVWIGGRHTRGTGFVSDMEKYNLAATMGWRILRVQPKDLLAPATFTMLAQAIYLTWEA